MLGARLRSEGGGARDGDSYGNVNPSKSQRVLAFVMCELLLSFEREERTKWEELAGIRGYLDVEVRL
jgi:hypothetical protein